MHRQTRSYKQEVLQREVEIMRLRVERDKERELRVALEERLRKALEKPVQMVLPIGTEKESERL